MTLKWRLWGTSWGALAGFWIYFACPVVAWLSLFSLFVDTWATLCRKVGSCDIDATLKRNRCLCRSGRQSWSHLGRKVTPERPKVASKGQVRVAGTVKLGRSVRSCCKRYGNVMETIWNQPDLSHVRGQSLSKRQDIWLDLLYICMCICIFYILFWTGMCNIF